MLDSENSVGQYLLQPIGYVRSSLKKLEDCQKQNWEGAPEAWVEIDPAFAEGLEAITPGSEVLLITWLHKARRNVLKVHPRGNPENPLRGVFATRSPDRPNPLGLHRVEILEVEGKGRFRVRALEVLEGTPVIDIKPVIIRSDCKTLSRGQPNGKEKSLLFEAMAVNPFSRRNTQTWGRHADWMA